MPPGNADRERKRNGWHLSPGWVILTVYQKCHEKKEKILQESPYYMKCERNLSKKGKIKNMNSKMTTNSQLSTNEPKKLKERKTMKTKTEQTTRTETESEKWRSHGGFSVGSGRGVMGGKVQWRRRIIGRY